MLKKQAWAMATLAMSLLCSNQYVFQQKNIKKGRHENEREERSNFLAGPRRWEFSGRDYFLIFWMAAVM
jgi:hypothetical protein